MSFDKLGLTLYDFLGYLLPGFLIVLGLSIATASFGEGTWLSVATLRSSPFGTLLAAYFLGHVAHILASRLKDRCHKCFDSTSGRLTPSMYDHVRLTARKAFSLAEGAKPSSLELYLLADSYAITAGKTGDRDVLMAREGFYKASMFSALVLTITLIATLIPGHAQLRIDATTVLSLGRWASIGCALCTLALAAVFRVAFLFFNRLKINNALLLFAAAHAFKAKDDKENADGGR